MLFLGAFALIISRILASYNVPLIMWSDHTNIFTSCNKYIGSKLNSQQVMHVFDNLLSNTANPDISSTLNHAPSAVIVFLFKTLTPADLSEYSETLLLSANSSIVLPHTIRDINLSHNSSIVLPHTIRSKDFNTNLLNGLHLVPIDSEEDIQNVLTAVQGQNYVFAVTGDESTELIMHRKLQSITCPKGYLINNVDPANPTCFSHFVYITPGILTGIFTGFFFLFAVLIGVSCLHGIQTPTRFSLIPPPHGKEF